MRWSGLRRCRVALRFLSFHPSTLKGSPENLWHRCRIFQAGSMGHRSLKGQDAWCLIMVCARCSALRLCFKLQAILILEGVKVLSTSCTAGLLVRTETGDKKMSITTSQRTS